MSLPTLRNRNELVGAILVGYVWAAVVIDWLWVLMLPSIIQYSLLGAIAIASMAWLIRCYFVHGARTPWFWVVFTITFPVFWQFMLYNADQFDFELLRAYVSRAGLVMLFLIGLIWNIWGVERIAQRIESGRRQQQKFDLQEVLQQKQRKSEVETWNPFDPAAWYYGRKSPRLNQSLSGFITYAYLFVVTCMILSQLRGCTQYYDLPAGGGEQQTVAQVVKVQKIIRKKFVVNPYSSILFDIPEIDEVQLELNEVTAHQYKIGYGEGEGAGFAGGTSKGVVGFYRLEYSGGDWDQDFGIGGDMNMLIKYTELTSQKIDKRTRAVTPTQLGAFDSIRSPPLIYITGQGTISLGKNDIKILKDYVNNKHGMLFGDNGGSKHFHNQFLSMMQSIAPDVKPVMIPADDKIHRVPFTIPKFPYVAPHGGTQAMGWFKDGRWICYYHPGDIGDAWADGHAGILPEVWNMCYRLGVNVINYAHAEHAKWRMSQEKKKGDKG